jgi:4-hydroxy-tetrahydrodipicolinate synthase
MPNHDIKGVIVPILTPLNRDETVDTTSLRRLTSYLIDNGVHGIWGSGTTGEFASISDKQRLISMEVLVDEVAGRIPVIGNVSGPSTELSLKMAMEVQGMGLDGVAVTPPYYYPHAQDELLDHYRYISDKSGLPLWVYNIPQTVKTAVAPITIATLAGEGAVVGVKDSSGAGELLAELNVLCEQGNIRLLRFLGTIYRTTNAGAIGVHGVIPAIANVVASACAVGWEAGERGDTDVVRECNAKLVVATRIGQLAKGGGPNAASLSGFKSALKLMGVLDDDIVSRPLRNMTEQEKAGLPDILKELGLDHKH